MIEAEQNMIKKGICPDCKCEEFLAGPEGPGTQNIECAGCGSRFNVSDFGVSRIGHRDKGKEEKDAIAKLGLLIVDHETGEAIRSVSDCGGDCLGVHELCHGYVNMHRISPTWNALWCRGCGLRKIFPATIDLDVYDRKTIWEHLIAYFEEKI